MLQNRDIIHILLLILTLHISLTASAQRPISHTIVPPVLPDSADLSYYRQPHFGQAAATIAGLNVGVWAFDRYVSKGDFAYISANSVKENFRHGFIWDNDLMGTNMFLHPYHGNLYFNSARSNGFNFWQSSLFAFGGSAMWELFMECEYPSTNDIVATPVGGTAIGEVFYRASDIVLNDTRTGWRRFGLEAAAFVLSPMRGLTRIINGDAWRKRSTPGRQFGIPNVAVELSSGTRIIELKDELFDSGIGATLQCNIEYGDRFDESDNAKPYDYFTFNAEINYNSSQPSLGELNIVGRLISRELLEHPDYKLSLGMYQHFDYYDSDTISDVSSTVPYKLGVPASLGCGLLYLDKKRGDYAFDAYFHGNAVILGAVLSDYYKVDDRNYNLASGFSLKSGINMAFKKDRFSLAGSYEYYRLFTWKGYPEDIDWNDYNPRTLNAQGDKSVATFGVATLRSDLRLWRHLYFTAQIAHYYRSTHYKDYPSVKSSTGAGELMLTYKF